MIAVSGLRAADDGLPANPILGGVDAADSAGIPLVAYQHLPLDRGSALDSHATMTAWLTDAMWTGHVGAIGIGVQLLDWVLTFGWIDWVLGPLDGVRRVVNELLGDVAWAPFALLVTAVVAGIVAVRGRLGAGVVQLIASAVCFALATTVMAAPLTSLTGSDDPVGDARHLGTGIADAIVADVLDIDRDADLDASEVSSAGTTALLSTQFVTLFVRGAAQEVAFGGSLADTPCDAVFTDAMLAEAPGPRNSGVREAVGACSETAAAYAEQPSLWQPFSVLVTMAGSIALLALVVALAMGLLIAVLAAMFASLRAMLWVNAAILPGIGRHRFVRALADIVTSLVAVMALIVAVAAVSALIVNVVGHAARSGAPITVQMAIVACVTMACAAGLASMRHRLRSGGRSAAAALRGFIAGPGAPPLSAVAVRGRAPSSQPITSSARESPGAGGRS